MSGRAVIREYDECGLIMATSRMATSRATKVVTYVEERRRKQIEDARKRGCLRAYESTLNYSNAVRLMAVADAKMQSPS
jgi:hypothetical protein